MEYENLGTRELIEELEEVTGKIGHYHDWGDRELINELKHRIKMEGRE